MNENNNQINDPPDYQVDATIDNDNRLLTKRNSSEIINENNKSGYCIDSVEPKCFELMRYISEFKQNYEIKFQNLERNKNLFEQIQVLKDYYLKGMELFNEQQIINMNADKSKKYLNEINRWQASFNELNINDECKNATKLLEANNTLLLLNANTNLKINMQDVVNQLKSLIIMFNKRSEQLKKIAFPTANKPVQRVEPQQMTENSKNSIELLLTTTPKQRIVSVIFFFFFFFYSDFFCKKKKNNNEKKRLMKEKAPCRLMKVVSS